MSTAVLQITRPVSGEVDELRKDVERLRNAIAAMSRAIVEANRGRALAEEQRQAAEDQLAVALELRAALESRLAGLERELGRQRTASAIRARLLADITQAKWWRRRPAIERAKRVERLLVEITVR
jgi:chromosome segregation ATPase